MLYEMLRGSQAGKQHGHTGHQAAKLSTTRQGGWGRMEGSTTTNKKKPQHQLSHTYQFDHTNKINQEIRWRNTYRKYGKYQTLKKLKWWLWRFLLCSSCYTWHPQRLSPKSALVSFQAYLIFSRLHLTAFDCLRLKIAGDFCLPPTYDHAVPPDVPTYVTITPRLLEVFNRWMYKTSHINWNVQRVPHERPRCLLSMTKISP